MEIPIFPHEFSAKKEVQMPQMQEVPRPVVPEPAPGNDAPVPQAGQKASQLTSTEKLEVNV